MPRVPMRRGSGWVMIRCRASYRPAGKKQLAPRPSVDRSRHFPCARCPMRQHSAPNHRRGGGGSHAPPYSSPRGTGRRPHPLLGRPTGAQCHHGYGECTADDVVYSLARSGDPKRSAFSSDFKDFDKAEATDKYTVKITLKNPVPSLLGLLINYQGGMMVCKKAAEEMGENFTQKPIGNGPCMLAA